MDHPSGSASVTTRAPSEDERSCVGPLPMAFFASALINFAVGSTLGLWMASKTSSWAVLASLHAEINPWGWLTMAIFGMTYAVLSISAELRLHPRVAGWVHLAIAELGIVLLVAGLAANRLILTRLGAVVQTASPVLFLTNILLAVRAKRQGRVQPPVIPEHLRYLGRREDCRRSDRVARRGTDLSGLLLVASAIWACWGIWSDGESSPGATVLLDDGWLIGTVVSVSLHFYPRLISGERMPAWPFSLFQAIWFPATVALSLGTAYHINMLAGVGRDALGTCLVWVAVVFEIALVRRSRGACGHGIGAVASSPATRLAWSLGYGFAGIAGGWMVVGRESDALPVLHALFLGWMTTLVYGTSYAVMPVLFDIRIRSAKISIAQLSISAIGVVLMMGGFADLDAPVGRALLAAGGGLAWLAFAWYFVRIGWGGIHILRRASTRAV